MVEVSHDRELTEQVRHAVESGVLVDDDMLPSIRALAEQLVVSHNTIARAYTELARDGVLDLRHGAGAPPASSPLPRGRRRKSVAGAGSSETHRC